MVDLARLDDYGGLNKYRLALALRQSMSVTDTVPDYLLKLLVIGDAAVGKTCLVQRFTDDLFVDSHIATIGVDFRIKTLPYDGKKVKLQVWDTAGQERFRAITQAYYRGAHGIALVYDATDKASFRNLESWLEEIERGAPASCQLILVANKRDLQQKHGGGVDPVAARAWAEAHGMTFLETSARENINVHEAFSALAHKCLDVPGLATGHPSKQERVSKKTQVLATPKSNSMRWFSLCNIL
eukprot:m.464163 g.464163  ORF g.464163 m.464163 type:complete len:241 (+) comp20356_c1_seq3:2041-2763(+)